MANVDIERVGKAYGAQRIFQGLDIAIKDGEFSGFGRSLWLGKIELVADDCRP